MEVVIVNVSGGLGGCVSRDGKLCILGKSWIGVEVCIMESCFVSIEDFI